MDFTQQTETERHAGVQAIDPVIKRSDVVAHFTDVVAQFRNALLIAGLESKEVGNARLRTLDPRTENRLDANVR